MADPTAKVTAAHLLELLRRHYLKGGPFPGGVLAHEVGQNGTANSRRCDAIFVGFTSTSGRLMVGHEVKISRSDWLHELAQPGKADRWADECHAWYVVAPSTDVVKPEELPPGWGLLVIRAGKLARQVKAVEHLDRVPAWWAVRSLMARLDTLREQEIAGRVERSLEVRTREIEQRLRERQQRGASLSERLATAIEARLGPGFRWADADDLAVLVAAVARDKDATRTAEQQLRYAVSDLKRARESIDYTLRTITNPEDTQP